MRPRFLLLTREGCGLCEEFAAELLGAFAAQLELQEADVDSREEWQRRWGLKIPVLLDGQGQLVCAVRLDPQAVAEALATSPRPGC